MSNPATWGHDPARARENAANRGIAPPWIGTDKGPTASQLAAWARRFNEPPAAGQRVAGVRT